MFDDQHPQGGGTPPNNLPVREPEDMFEGTDPVAPSDDADNASQMSQNTDASSQTVAGPSIQETKRAASNDTPQEGTETSANDQQADSGPTAIEAGKLQPKQVASGTNTPEEQEIPLASPPPVGTTPANTQDEAADLSMSTRPHQGDGVEMQQKDMRGPNIGKIILIVFLVLVGAAIIGAGIWYAVTVLLADTNNMNEDTSSAPAVVEVPVVEPEIEPDMPTPTFATTTAPTTNETTTISADDAPSDIPRPTQGTISDEDAAAAASDTTENQILFGDDIDTDEDTLSDEREVEFGTDPRNWDTDGDGLGDGVEVLNWETDPLDPDTDGDGYLDGAEVNAGYSPLVGGGARLFETETTTMTTSSAS